MAVDLNFVTSRLATGAQIASVDDAKAIAALGVTHVVDARAELDDAAFFAGTSMLYLWNPTDDDGTTKPPEYWKQTLEFALPAVAQPRTKVYLHCAAGVNRGPSNALCVMVALGWSAEDAETAIRKARPQVGLAYKHDAVAACETLGYVVR